MLTQVATPLSQPPTTLTEEMLAVFKYLKGSHMEEGGSLLSVTPESMTRNTEFEVEVRDLSKASNEVRQVDLGINPEPYTMGSTSVPPAPPL